MSMYTKTLQITKRETLDLWPETARLLGIGRNSVYQAARRGDFRTVRVGKRILVPKSEIRRLLKCGSRVESSDNTAAGSEWEAQ